MPKIPQKGLVAACLSAALLAGCAPDPGGSPSEIASQAKPQPVQASPATPQTPAPDPDPLSLQMQAKRIDLAAASKEGPSLQAVVRENDPGRYEIDYQDSAGNSRGGVFSAVRYDTQEQAAKALAEFTGAKEVPKRAEAAQDLGHGIQGYTEGAAGHAYLGWKEGRWNLVITSNSADQVNQREIARQMVEYLETRALPAPRPEGMVFVEYPSGAREPQVDIRWQEGDIVYRLRTQRPPLEALGMAVSVK